MRIDFALLFGIILLSGAWAEPQKGGAISGIVTNRITGEPIRKAEVTVLDSHDAFGVSITDSEGRYQVSGLPPGEYRVRVSHAGFERAAYGSRGPDRPGRILTLGENEARAGVAISLLPLGVITGVVLDEDGDPVPNAQVQLYRRVYNLGQQHLNHRDSTIANERGEYRLYNVPPGRYYLCAEPTNGPIVYENVPGREFRFSGIVIKEFYPSADDVSAAETVSPIPGKELRGIDIRLRRRAAARVRGNLILPANAPAKGEWNVRLHSPDQLDWAGGGTGGTLPADTFLEVAAEPGKYMVVANLTGDGKRYRGVLPVELTSGAEPEISVALQPAVDMAGVVQVEGPESQKYRHFRINLVPRTILDYEHTPRASTQADLHFKLSNVLPGTWDIGVEPIPEGGFLKAMYLGDLDVLTEDMTIGPKPEILKIVISTQGAKLEGDLDGNPLKDGARASILLAPAGKFSRVLSFFHTSVTDAKGHFRLDGLRPGQYNVFAFEDMAPDAYQDPEFLKPFAKWAQPVELRGGQTSSAKLRMIPVSMISEARE